MSHIKNVERGMALLDEKLGTDWPKAIDTERLDMSSCGICIVGQLFLNTDLFTPKADTYTDKAAYREGCRSLGITDEYDEAATYGFNLPSDILATNRKWKNLGNVWKKKITARLSA